MIFIVFPHYFGFSRFHSQLVDGESNVLVFSIDRWLLAAGNFEKCFVFIISSLRSGAFW
jgi:hypothetical protein